MAWERIKAITMVRPARPPRPDTVSQPPITAETVQSASEVAGADSVLATTASGEVLNLVGLNTLGRALAPGDVLLVKVLATAPQLQVALFDTAPRPASDATPPFEDAHAAMRTDQLALLRQVDGRAPDAQALAASWRSMVLEAIERLAAARASANASGGHGSPELLALPSDETAAAPETWLLAAFNWGAPRLVLRLLAADADEAPTRKRRLLVLALQYDLLVAELGRVSVQIRLGAEGMVLNLAVERSEAQVPMRAALPALAAAIARAGLHLARCDLEVGLPTLAGSPFAAAWESVACGTTPATALPPELFRAAAEVALALVALSSRPPEMLSLTYR